MLKGQPVEAVVLDMDGVLIDTEPVWRAAQSAVFAGFGVTLSEGDLLDSTGQPIEELIPVWRRRAPAPDPAGTGLTDAGIADLIMALRRLGVPVPGRVSSTRPACGSSPGPAGRSRRGAR